MADDNLQSLRSKAPRRVTIVFEAQAAHEPPAGLRIEQRDGLCWQCEWVGDAGPLVQWAAGQSLRDLTINEPDLEVMFHRHYHAEGEAS